VSRHKSLILVALSIAVGGAFVVGLLFRLQILKRGTITDRELLKEAAQQWKLSAEPNRGPNLQIFEQQATQGYYDDAWETARLSKSNDVYQDLLVRLAAHRKH